MCDDDEDDVPDMREENRMQIQKANWQVVHMTTPANYFHALRRQIYRDFRKPLVVVAPKSLLRHKGCVSALADVAEGTKFKRVIGERDPEIAATPEKVERLVFCTGKVYYDLVAKREELGLTSVAICTVEQLAPFPFDRVAEEMRRYPNVDHGDGVHPGEVVWCQEEPKNMGAWPYVRPRMVTTAREGLEKDTVLRYAGRRSAASTATGFAKLHAAEHQTLVEYALLGRDEGAGVYRRASKLLGHTT